MHINDHRKKTLQAVISDYPEGACPVQLSQWASGLVGFPQNGEAAARVCEELLQEMREEGSLLECVDGRLFARA